MPPRHVELPAKRRITHRLVDHSLELGEELWVIALEKVGNKVHHLLSGENLQPLQLQHLLRVRKKEKEKKRSGIDWK